VETPAVKAIVYEEYGPPDVLRYADVDAPVPAAGEVLIKVRAASVNPADWHFMRGTPYFLRLGTGLRTPSVTRLGIDVAGQVEAVGRAVTRFKPGDAVFGSCRGSLAEYATARESALTIKPPSVSFEHAASTPVAALTALQALRDAGRLRAGEQVLINGASGGVGTFAVQVATWLGGAVTGVCSARNGDLVRSIGAARVIDYARHDFTAGGERYDLILDCVGNHSLSRCRRVLNRHGTYIMIGAPAGPWMLGALTRALAAVVITRFVRHRLTGIIGKPSAQDLATTGELMATGRIVPVIDRRFGLHAAADALRYLEAGHARGKVLIGV
jgi:NADPH:quinone reductase-like Zn-dependent oxidoreductase